ncbi:MAG: hypothetical protein IKG37_09760, partial [Solobacterium sp.]|nr:hypothetical protein [Solobacterium sp.]
MRKSIVILLTGVLLAGCASATVQPEQSAAPVRSVQHVAEETEPVVQRTYGTLKQKAEEVAEKITSASWEELSSLFQQDQRSAFSAAVLQEKIETAASGPYTIRETDPYVRDDLFGAIVLLDSSSGLLEAVFTVNE